MPGSTEAKERLIDEAAARHGLSRDAVSAALSALVAGGSTQAQFDHPELGGLGQWSRGGMIMIGDMFNGDLKHRVAALCDELAAALRNGSVSPARQASAGDVSHSTNATVHPERDELWPADLGRPSSSGSQNSMRYAVFPDKSRLAVHHGGATTIYDTGDHRIGGVSQAQSGSQSLTFTSQHGPVRLDDLTLVKSETQDVSAGATSLDATTSREDPPTRHAADRHGDDVIFSRLERLSELREKDVITQAEFDSKKAELLARL